MMDTICFVNHDLSVIGGDKTVTVNVANELCKSYKVILVSICNRRGTLAYQLDERITYINLEIDNSLRLREKMLKAFVPLLRIYKKNTVRVAFLEENKVGFIGSIAQPFTKTKLVYCDHGSIGSELEKKEVVTMRKMASALCHKTVVLTKHSLETYLKEFGTNKNKISYIYNWIPSNLLEPERTYDEESKTILSIGRLDKEKGYDLLVKVAKEFLADNPDWQWHIYGTGDLDLELQQWIDDAGLEKQIILQGLQSDLFDAYTHASILVLPSYREGMPIVLLEAIAYMVPAVSFDIITGPREMLRDGENGYIVPPYDVQEMARKIQYLINHPEERKRFALNMRLDVEQFRMENILKQWIDLIEQC